MATLSSSQIIQKRLVENITLLWTLCEVPGESKENDTQVGQDEGRQLSLDRERQLTDSFAFISATTDDMQRVMAVSIEEDSDGKGMTVRLASNTGDLSDVTQGLSGIARTLEQASLRKKPRIDIQQDLFRQIVTLDEPRILSRLRSIHAEESRKTRGKPELLYLLSRAVHDKSIRGRKKTTKANITNIRSCSKELSEIFSSFETVRWNNSPIGPSRDMLIDLLIRIDGFDVDALQTVLEKSLTIDPSIRDYLPQAMSKLGRYFRIACDLISAARSPEYTLFRRISVRSIEEPQLNMAFIADHSTRFDQAAQRFTQESHRHFLHANNSALVSVARTKYESRISSPTALWKVHAEIQLLLFYEGKPHVPRPRIIGSSKSACYLCDLFIHVHGEFGTPRTHGRLYDRWMLPEQSISQPAVNERLLSVIDEFNATLEAKINDTLHHRTRPFPQPNESVLHLRQPWSSNSTLAETLKQASIAEIVDPTHSSPSKDRPKPPSESSPDEQASIQELLDPPAASSSRKQSPIQKTASPTRPDSSIDPKTPPRNTPPHSPPTPPASTPRDQSISQPQPNNLEPDIHLTQRTETTPSSTTATHHHHHLYPGPGTSTFHNLLTPHDTLIINTGPLLLHASWATNRTPNNNLTNNNEEEREYPPRACWIHVQCTTTSGPPDDDDDEDGNFEFVDVEEITEDRDMVVEGGSAWSLKRLAFRVPGNVGVVVVKYSFGDR